MQMILCSENTYIENASKMHKTKKQKHKHFISVYLYIHKKSFLWDCVTKCHVNRVFKALPQFQEIKNLAFLISRVNIIHSSIPKLPSAIINYPCYSV